MSIHFVLSAIISTSLILSYLIHTVSEVDAVITLLIDEKSEAQRGYVIYSRSHS